MNSPFNEQKYKDLLEGLEITEILLSEVLKENFTRRIDSEYFKKEYLKITEIIEKQQFDILSKIGKIKGGKRLPLGENFSEEGVPYIRAQDIKNSFVDYSNSPKISLQLHKILQRYQTRKNDVLITNVGNSIGDVGIIKFDLDKCNLTENAVKVIVEKVLPEFLFVFLLSKYGNLQIRREAVGTAQPKLALERINLFKVPLLSLDFQNKIEEIVKTAHLKREQSQTLYRQAEELLLETIGLEPGFSGLKDEQDYNKEKSCKSSNQENQGSDNNKDCQDFLPQSTTKDIHKGTQRKNLVNLENLTEILVQTKTQTNYNIKTFKESFLTTGRLDAEYYQPKYENYINLVKKYEFGYELLQNVCNLKDSNFTPDETKEYQYIELADIGKSGNITGCTVAQGNELPSRARRKVNTSDVIISSIEGSLESCALITNDYNNALCSTGFYVINSEKINSETLLVLFKSEVIQNIMKQGCSGTILTAINKTEFQNISIPLINKEIQQQISAFIQESFALRRQSEQLLDEAKEMVEREINN